MLTLLLHLLAPLLASNERTLVASVEQRDVHQLYGEYARGQGYSGAQARLSCKVLAGPFTLCLKVEEQGRRRFVTQADLLTWELGVEQARAQAAASLSLSPWSLVDIEGGGGYWRAQGARADATLLHPEWLAEIGASVRVAMPARGVLVAWPEGDPELDHIMAVGVRRMHTELPGALSPVVLSWDGERWAEWGRAKARAPEATTPAAAPTLAPSPGEGGPL